MIGVVIDKAIAYFGSDIKRISHFLKVYGFARTIGQMEQLDEQELEILEVTAVLHDIGIKVSEQKYGSSAGNYQELEGPPVAREILKSLDYEDTFIQRVEYLIGHHHTYQNIQEKDYQILVEADFLVNIHEDSLERQSILSIRDKIFRTRTGLKLINTIYLEEK